LLLVGPAETRSWVAGRYGPLLDRTGRQSSRRVRLATSRELQFLHALGALSADDLTDSISLDHQEAV